MLNVFLDVILILILKFGVEGAGIATFLSQAFASWLCWHFIKRNMRILVPMGDERDFDNKKISILLNNGRAHGTSIFYHFDRHHHASKCKQRFGNRVCSFVYGCRPH